MGWADTQFLANVLFLRLQERTRLVFPGAVSESFAVIWPRNAEPEHFAARFDEYCDSVGRLSMVLECTWPSPVDKCTWPSSDDSAVVRAVLAFEHFF